MKTYSLIRETGLVGANPDMFTCVCDVLMNVIGQYMLCFVLVLQLL